MGSNGERFDWLRFEDVFVCVFILEEYVRVTGCSGIVFSVFLLPYDIPTTGSGNYIEEHLKL